MTAIYVEFDTDRDNTWNAAVDGITGYVIDVSIATGFDNEMAHTANIGQCFLTLNNADRRFSPNNATSPLYGLLTPFLPVRVRDDTRTLFRGYVKSIEPEAGTLSTGRCLILAEDALTMFQRETIEIPPLVDINSGTLAKIVTADVFSGVAATGSFAFNGLVAENETITVNGVIYRAKATPERNYDVKLSTVPGVYEERLTAAVNGDIEDTTVYYSGTPSHTDVKASYSAADGIADQTGSVSLGYVYSDVAASYMGESKAISKCYIIMQKSGAPTNITVRVVDDHTTNTLVDPNATATITAAAVGTGWSAITVTFAGSFLIRPGDYIKLSCGAEDAGNYYNIGTGTGTPVHAGYKKDYAGGTWTGANDFSVLVEGTLTLTAPARGTYANAFTISSGAANVVASGVNLAGGTDGIDSLLSVEAGVRTLKFAGATWVSGETDGWQALNDVVRSEFGYAWVARNGTVTVKNKDWEFTRYLATPALTIAGEHQQQTGALSDRTVINRALVTYVPGDQTETGIVASSASPIAVPGKSFMGAGKWPRFNRLNGYAGTGSPSTAPGPGDKVVTLPFVDAYGERVGARDVGVPVPVTDYTVNDSADGTGFNYTSTGRITVSIAASGSGVEISFRNDATGTLYIRGLQVRGTLIKQHASEKSQTEDATSISTYGRRQYTYDLTFDSGAVFAEAIPYYLIYRYSNPVYAVERITFEGPMSVGGDDLLSVEIGDVIGLTEYQTAVTAHKYLVRGIMYDIKAGGEIVNVTFAVKRLDQQTYIIFDHATSGQFNNGAAFAL